MRTGVKTLHGGHCIYATFQTMLVNYTGISLLKANDSYIDPEKELTKFCTQYLTFIMRQYAWPFTNHRIIISSKNITHLDKSATINLSHIDIPSELKNRSLWLYSAMPHCSPPRQILSTMVWNTELLTVVLDAMGSLDPRDFLRLPAFHHLLSGLQCQHQQTPASEFLLPDSALTSLPATEKNNYNLKGHSENANPRGCCVDFFHCVCQVAALCLAESCHIWQQWGI